MEEDLLQITAEESGERIDALLARILPELSRSAAQRLLEEKRVLLRGRTVKKNYRCAAGDCFAVSLPEAAENSKPSWFGFLISVRLESRLDRNAVTKYVEEHNIQTRLLFSGTLVRHPCFDPIRGTDAYRVAGGLEETDFVMNNTFWVGVYPGMTDEMLDYIAKTILEAIE